MDQLRVLLANTYLLYFKSQSYHWNVEGQDFPQLHGFFGDFCSEVYGSIDHIAEEIRALDQYAPINLIGLLVSGNIKEDSVKPSTGRDMVSNLLVANSQYLQSLNDAFAAASDKQGLANFLADRIDVHSKLNWQLKALLK